jgi:hypothetical protein
MPLLTLSGALVALLSSVPITPSKDPITPEMLAALGRINSIHLGMDRKTVDEAVEDLHREIAKHDPKVFVPLIIPQLLNLVPQDTQTRILLRRALSEGWLDEYHARVLLVRAGDTPDPHVKVLLKALDNPDAKKRRIALQMVGGLGAEGREAVSKLKKIIADAKADPSDYSRDFTSTDEVPNHVLAYWSMIQIEAALKKKGTSVTAP